MDYSYKSIENVVSEYMFRILIRANDVFRKNFSNYFEYKFYHDYSDALKKYIDTEFDYDLNSDYVEEYEFFYISLLYAMTLEEGSAKDFYNSHGLFYNVLKENVLSINYHASDDDSCDYFDDRFMENVLSHNILNKNEWDILNESWLSEYLLPSFAKYFCFPHKGASSTSFDKFISDLNEKVNENITVTNTFNDKKIDNDDNINDIVDMIDRFIKIDLSSKKSLPLHLENLTEKEYDANPLVGYKDELKNLAITLCMPKHSALIVGPAGCGKTTLVDGLAYKIKNGDIEAFKGYSVLSISASDLIEGCSFVGMLEERVNGLINYCLGKKILLFIDEMHMLIGAGQGSKTNIDVANIFKPYLADGRLKIIGATTKEEYDEIIKKDNAFNRRFGLIKMDEPNQVELRNIIADTFERFSRLYNVKITFDDVKLECIIDELCNLTSQKKNRVYNDMRYNPSLVVSIIERAFGIAIYDGTGLKISDVIEAIKYEESLYPIIRNNCVKRINAIKDVTLEDDKYEIQRRKIIMS